MLNIICIMWSAISRSLLGKLSYLFGTYTYSWVIQAAMLSSTVGAANRHVDDHVWAVNLVNLKWCVIKKKTQSLYYRILF
jgi:hypothetical protein